MEGHTNNTVDIARFWLTADVSSQFICKPRPTTVGHTTLSFTLGVTLTNLELFTSGSTDMIATKRIGNMSRIYFQYIINIFLESRAVHIVSDKWK